jgi:hypothetical protein
MTDAPQLPMGRIDAVDAGSRKLTVQTEFFPQPTWRVETKIYVGGALKKVHKQDLSCVPAEELQSFVDRFHKEKLREIVDALQALRG